MKADGVQRAACFITSAYSSYSGCRQYRENIAAAQEEVGPTAPQIDKLRVFFNHPGFIEPMIESLRGIENLEAICAVPGVNAVFVGPNDLTTTMGIPNEYDHPDLVAALKRIIDTAEARHVAAGCWFGKREQMLRTIRQGARFNVYSNDGSLLREALEQSFGLLRKG